MFNQELQYGEHKKYRLRLYSRPHQAAYLITGGFKQGSNQPGLLIQGQPQNGDAICSDRDQQDVHHTT